MVDKYNICNSGPAGGNTQDKPQMKTHPRSTRVRTCGVCISVKNTSHFWGHESRVNIKLMLSSFCFYIYLMLRKQLEATEPEPIYICTCIWIVFSTFLNEPLTHPPPSQTFYIYMLTCLHYASHIDDVTTIRHSPINSTSD